MARRKYKRRIYKAGRPVRFAPWKPAEGHRHQLKLIERLYFGAAFKVWICEDPRCSYSETIRMETT